VPEKSLELDISDAALQPPADSDDVVTQRLQVITGEGAEKEDSRELAQEAPDKIPEITMEEDGETKVGQPEGLGKEAEDEEEEEVEEPQTHRMTTRARAQVPSGAGTGTGSTRTRSNSSSSTASMSIHPLFLRPANTRPDRDFGLPPLEAEETRRMLLQLVQKREEAVRGSLKLLEGLRKAERMRKTVLRWSKAEGRPALPNNEDWYDREEWGLEDDLVEGHNEEEDEATGGAKKPRTRRADRG
jgi:hypothetical protein